MPARAGQANWSNRGQLVKAHAVAARLRPLHRAPAGAGGPGPPAKQQKKGRIAVNWSKEASWSNIGQLVKSPLGRGRSSAHLPARAAGSDRSNRSLPIKSNPTDQVEAVSGQDTGQTGPISANRSNIMRWSSRDRTGSTAARPSHARARPSPVAPRRRPDGKTGQTALMVQKAQCASAVGGQAH